MRANQNHVIIKVHSQKRMLFLRMKNNYDAADMIKNFSYTTDGIQRTFKESAKAYLIPINEIDKWDFFFIKNFKLTKQKPTDVTGLWQCVNDSTRMLSVTSRYEDTSAGVMRVKFTQKWNDKDGTMLENSLLKNYEMVA